MAGDRHRLSTSTQTPSRAAGTLTPLPSAFAQLTDPFSFSLQVSPVITGGYARLGQRRPPKSSFEFEFQL